jgi:hypothetical protein
MICKMTSTPTSIGSIQELIRKRVDISPLYASSAHLAALCVQGNMVRFSKNNYSLLRENKFHTQILQQIASQSRQARKVFLMVFFAIFAALREIDLQSL